MGRSSIFFGHLLSYTRLFLTSKNEILCVDPSVHLSRNPACGDAAAIAANSNQQEVYRTGPGPPCGHLSLEPGCLADPPEQRAAWPGSIAVESKEEHVAHGQGI